MCDTYTGRLVAFLDDPGHWTGHAAIPTTTFTNLGERHDSLDRLVQAATNVLLDRHPQTIVA